MKKCIQLMSVFLLLMVPACTPAAAPAAGKATPTNPSTVTLLPTQTPSITPLPTETATPTATETTTPEPSSTFTPIVYLPPSATHRPPIKKRSPTETVEPTPTATATATFCPLPTPEPLWVEPVTSPTDQLSQLITIHVGYGTEVTITTESGTFSAAGSFGVYANPALVEITLLPNTTHHLDVTANIQPPPHDGCTYPGYKLHTTQDKNGAPLVIVQGTPVP